MTLAIWVTSALTALEVGAGVTAFVGDAILEDGHISTAALEMSESRDANDGH
jgi:hypothetical protein